MSKIFISYRRDDSPYPIDGIYTSLVSHFGKEQIFKDIDVISGGVDFRGAIEVALNQCKVMLVIIGPKWTNMINVNNEKRLFSPDDFVRIEIEAAILRNILVIPIYIC